MHGMASGRIWDRSRLRNGVSRVESLLRRKCRICSEIAVPAFGAPALGQIRVNTAGALATLQPVGCRVRVIIK
jgi:hypothetical protein